jgi:hypothetical protein
MLRLMRRAGGFGEDVANLNFELGVESSGVGKGTPGAKHRLYSDQGTDTPIYIFPLAFAFSAKIKEIQKCSIVRSSNQGRVVFHLVLKADVLTPFPCTCLVQGTSNSRSAC